MIRLHFREIARRISIIYFNILLSKVKVPVYLNMTVLLNKTSTKAKKGRFFPWTLRQGLFQTLYIWLLLFIRYLMFPPGTAWFILYYVTLFSFLHGIWYYVKGFFTCLVTKFHSKNCFTEILSAILSRLRLHVGG